MLVVPRAVELFTLGELLRVAGVRDRAPALCRGCTPPEGGPRRAEFGAARSRPCRTTGPVVAAGGSDRSCRGVDTGGREGTVNTG